LTNYLHCIPIWALCLITFEETLLSCRCIHQLLRNTNPSMLWSLRTHISGRLLFREFRDSPFTSLTALHCQIYLHNIRHFALLLFITDTTHLLGLPLSAPFHFHSSLFSNIIPQPAVPLDASRVSIQLNSCFKSLTLELVSISIGALAINCLQPFQISCLQWILQTTDHPSLQHVLLWCQFTCHFRILWVEFLEIRSCHLTLDRVRVLSNSEISEENQFAVWTNGSTNYRLATKHCINSVHDKSQHNILAVIFSLVILSIKATSSCFFEVDQSHPTTINSNVHMAKLLWSLLAMVVLNHIHLSNKEKQSSSPSKTTKIVEAINIHSTFILSSALSNNRASTSWCDHSTISLDILKRSRGSVRVDRSPFVLRFVLRSSSSVLLHSKFVCLHFSSRTLWPLLCLLVDN
jgi:hypothetical protein